jgi:hypothetical protein
MTCLWSNPRLRMLLLVSAGMLLAELLGRSLQAASDPVPSAAAHAEGMPTLALRDLGPPGLPPPPALPQKSEPPPGGLELTSVLEIPAPEGPQLADKAADPPPAADKDQTQPAPLERPLESPPQAAAPPTEAAPAGTLYTAPFDGPLGYAGPSGILPRETQQDNYFVPVEDRWRIGFPSWDRYGNGHPLLDDYPYVEGNICDPYNQNILKGDYPILGQHTFFILTGELLSIFEGRAVPTATTPFESTARPHETDFFGRPDQFFTTNYLTLSFDLFHGDAAFRQPDWRIKLTPVFDFNYLSVDELGVVSPDVTRGTVRGRTFFTLEEWFAETKIADLSPNFDFLSVRAGSQPFTSDFRGFIFSDLNRAVRFFGTLDDNRIQYNLAVFSQQEKDTNSGLNTFDDRHQTVLIANMYIQDFIFPGYTVEPSIHYNHDEPTVKYDQNGFLVRPDPAGAALPHQIDVVYLGWAGDGHINRFNINHESYWAVGHDSLNPIANTPQDISAFMNAIELSYDRDWMRFRISGLWASGDSDPRNGHATGFDSILDNPNFAGGDFTYWQRQAVPLLGVNLANRQSFFPDLRASKIQGQSNFVNPGLKLVNFGVDADITPKLRMINNCNLMWFDKTQVLDQFTYQSTQHTFIGTDLSSGFEYRPLLSNNIIFRLGIAGLITGRGFDDLYGDATGHGPAVLLSGFLETVLQY